MKIVTRFIDWIESLTGPKCQHLWEARFRIEGEWGIGYFKCLLCGKEKD